MADKIHVISKRPGCPPRSVWVSNSLENLQRSVGGQIETYTFATDMCVICNEEGRLQGFPHCCAICGVDFVGTVVIAGIAGSEFADLPGDYQKWKRMFPSLWEE